MQGSRVCLAVPGGTTPPKGMLLGSSTGGSIVYVEPTAAVPLNNDLAAARGEAYAAEESVLWKLTGIVMEALDSLQHILDVVSHCMRQKMHCTGAICLCKAQFHFQQLLE